MPNIFRRRSTKQNPMSRAHSLSWPSAVMIYLPLSSSPSPIGCSVTMCENKEIYHESNARGHNSQSNRQTGSHLYPLSPPLAPFPSHLYPPPYGPDFLIPSSLQEWWSAWQDFTEWWPGAGHQKVEITRLSSSLTLIHDLFTVRLYQMHRW